jgi:predicted  nucleic acid-binding Zn-ribbon protein
MPHTCDDCGEAFDTLSGLRLHECPEDESTAVEDMFEDRRKEISKQERKTERRVKRAASEDMTDAIEQAQQGDEMAVYQALAQYERQLSDEWAQHQEGDYWGFHRVFFGPVVEGLETIVERDGWPFLLDVLDAYWPEVTYDFDTYSQHEAFGGAERGDFDEYSHISHGLATVTGKQLCRTRRADGVAAIPVEALDYLMLFHRHPGDTQPWIDSMSYGWGIGHPDHPFEEHIETIVDGEYEIWASTAIEHAMHADQHAATDLVETLFAAGIVSDPAQILHLLGRIDDGYPPDTSDHWDWETLLPEFHADDFDWDPAVRDRLESVVVDCGLARQLPDDWEFTDIVL